MLSKLTLWFLASSKPTALLLLPYKLSDPLVQSDSEFPLYISVCTNLCCIWYISSTAAIQRSFSQGQCSSEHHWSLFSYIFMHLYNHMDMVLYAHHSIILLIPRAIGRKMVVLSRMSQKVFLPNYTHALAGKRQFSHDIR